MAQTCGQTIAPCGYECSPRHVWRPASGRSSKLRLELRQPAAVIQHGGSWSLTDVSPTAPFVWTGLLAAALCLAAGQLSLWGDGRVLAVCASRVQTGHMCEIFDERELFLIFLQLHHMWYTIIYVIDVE